MADFQTSLSLILQARDEATPVFNQVGERMASLGQQAERAMAAAQGQGLGVGRTDATKAALNEQIRLIQAGTDATKEAKAREVALWKAAAEADTQTVKEAAAFKKQADRDAAEVAKVLAQGEAQSTKQLAQERAQILAAEADRTKTLAQAGTRLQKQMAQEQAQAERATAQAARDAARVRQEAIRADASAMRESAREARAIDQEIIQAERAVAQAARETARARKQADREARQAAKEYEAALHNLKSTAETAFGPVGHLVEMGRQMLVWGIGYQAVMSVYSAAMQAAGGLITTNVQLEQLSMTFAAIYQTNATQGRAMITWLDQFATKVPGTRQEVREAALAFAAAGDNVREILPAASNLAAIMGTDLPTAAHAMVDAQMGRFEMLQTTLKTTKEQLRSYGLEVDRVGHVTGGTFVPAIERYVQMRFGEHVAFDTAAVQDFDKHLQAAGIHAGETTNLLAKAASVQAGAMPGDTAQQQRAQQAVLTQTVTAVQQAQMGHMQALQQMYGVTAADLDKIDKGWRRTGDAAAAAFVQWYAATHGGIEALRHVHPQMSAIMLQMQTLGGAFSNIKDSLTNLQEVMGAGMFNVLKDQAIAFYAVLQRPDITLFAKQVGTVLGNSVKFAADRFKEWFAAIGGLPGLFNLIQTAAKDVWAAIQGLGDVFHEVAGAVHNILAPIQAIFSVFDTFGGGSKGTAQSIRFLVVALVDLFAAMKALEGIKVIQAVFASVGAEMARIKTDALRLATANRELAVSQTAVATTAREEMVAETATGAALARRAPAVPGGIGPPVPAGMALEMETATRAGAGFVSTLGNVGKGFYASLGPMAAFMADLYLVPQAIDAAVLAIQTLRGIDVKGLQTDLTLGIHKAAYQSGIGAPGTLHDVQLSGPGAFAAYLQRQGGQEAYAAWERFQRTQAPGRFIDYVQRLPQARMEQVAREYGREGGAGGAAQIRAIAQGTAPGLTAAQSSNVYVAFNQAVARTAQDAVSQFSKQTLPSDVQRQVTAYGDIYRAQHQQASDKAVGAAVDAYARRTYKQYGQPLPEGFGAPPGAQGALYTGEAYQKNLQQEQQRLTASLERNAPWETIRNAFGSVQEVARRGAREAGQSAQAMMDTIRAAIQQISQHFAQKLKWDESLGMPMTVLRQDVEDWIGHLQEIHTPLQDIAEQVVPSILELAQQDIPDLVKAAPDEVAAYFATLKRELARSGLHAAEQAAAFAKVYSDFQKAQVQQIEQELQTDVALGTVSVGDETSLVDKAIQGRLKINADAIKAHKPAPYSENDIALFRKQSLDAIAQPAVQAAQTTLQYDELIKAPWSKIVADIGAYSAALSRTSTSAQEQEILVQQAWQSARQKRQQNIELQLQFDQMMGASFATIVSDISAMGRAATAAGEDPRAVAIRMHDLITQATETRLQEAVASGASLTDLHRILDDGTVALRSAGLSRVAVERWAAQEIRNVIAARIQQEQAASRAAFDLAQQQGRIRTPQDVMHYVNAQRVLERQLPGPPGETQAQRQVRQTTDMNQVIQAGFQGIIDRQQKAFEWETGPGGNVVSALKDENLIIKYSQLQWKAMGMSPDDMKLSTNLLRRQLDQQRLGGQPLRPEPQYQPYGRLGREPGFGATDIYFGHPATNALVGMVQQLREMVNYWRTQAETYKAALDEAKKTTRNTHATAQGIQTLVNHQTTTTTQPNAPANVTSQIRGRGGWTPV